MLGNRLAAARQAEAPPHRAQNDEIDGGNGEQEKCRGAGADQAADRLELLEAALQREGGGRDRRDRDGNGKRMPSEKNRPTDTGRLPSCISLRTTLSMVAMWSASTAWRSPST